MAVGLSWIAAVWRRIASHQAAFAAESVHPKVKSAVKRLKDAFIAPDSTLISVWFQ